MSANNRKKAVFLDIDGTILKKGSGPFADDREAMEEAAEKGHLLFLNTGRSFANIPKALLEFSFFSGISAGGGAHILLADSENQARQGSPAKSRFKTVYHKWIPDDVLERIFAWYDKQPSFCILEAEQNCYIINGSHQLHMAREPISVNSFDEFKRKSSGDLVTKITLDGFASSYERSLLESFFKVNCFAEYSEAVIKGENKGKAMELILGNTGIEKEDSIAIGDSANDLDMFHCAGLAIAMGNAPDEIKAAAGAVSAECGNGGVAAALKKFVLSGF